MKKQLYIYAALIIIFIVYNQFFQLTDNRLNEAINILFASVLFLYIGYLAYLLLKKLKK
ncbi:MULTISPECIES: hypothetical protein [unclassified Kaistella]|uniref:hypothetical protein n=1 Tax=unclassified Kaistella TaxID=2762626 RepID=UPI0027340734|nr:MULTISPECIES: hypothetical protein [unclassified Kaistella]MCZ2085516.1 hypothetical protein [Flavobacteriales bacterium]MDP2453506.1 hypothetical protein [Kaistella sp. SH11-4b]MDP2456563.1 hypothetical protein [Kaistella sp. SH40-3]MDP2459319.1 hypothetical protein [Kaistella sp. SH19-2b]